MSYESIYYLISNTFIHLKTKIIKNIGKVILAALIMMIIEFQVNAQNAATSNQSAQKQNAVESESGNIVDKDNNGICDKFETRSGKGRGGNFVDKN